MRKPKPTAAIRNAVLAVTKDMPGLQTALDRIGALCPELQYAVEGIWCGSEGRESILIPAWDVRLVIAWDHGKAENAYIS